jgi:hypothetical protein
MREGDDAKATEVRSLAVILVASEKEKRALAALANAHTEARHGSVEVVFLTLVRSLQRAEGKVC